VAAVDLAGDLDMIALDDELRGEGALRTVEKGGKHLAGLAAIVVDRLLAENDEAGILCLDDLAEDLRDGERLDRAFGLHQDAAIGAHGERVADGLDGLGRSDRDGDDLFGLAGLLLAEGFLDGDLVEGVDRHLHIGEVDAGAVRLHPDLDVEIDDPFDGYDYFHSAGPLGGVGWISGAADPIGPLAASSTICASVSSGSGS
jgi:hypothetical protein